MPKSLARSLLILSHGAILRLNTLRLRFTSESQDVLAIKTPDRPNFHLPQLNLCFEHSVDSNSVDPEVLRDLCQGHDVTSDRQIEVPILSFCHCKRSLNGT
jgi:hypothetical protein